MWKLKGYLRAFVVMAVVGGVAGNSLCTPTAIGLCSVAKPNSTATRTCCCGADCKCGPTCGVSRPASPTERQGKRDVPATERVLRDLAKLSYTADTVTFLSTDLDSGIPSVPSGFVGEPRVHTLVYQHMLLRV